MSPEQPYKIDLFQFQHLPETVPYDHVSLALLTHGHLQMVFVIGSQVDSLIGSVCNFLRLKSFLVTTYADATHPSFPFVYLFNC